MLVCNSDDLFCEVMLAEIGDEIEYRLCDNPYDEELYSVEITEVIFQK